MHFDLPTGARFAAPRILPRRDVSHLDAMLLDEAGRLRVCSAEQLQAVPAEDLAIWAYLHGVYGFPTAELIEWLAAQRHIGCALSCGDRWRMCSAGVKTIEIGAGNGAIGRGLGIPCTDSKNMERDDVRLMYAAMGQPTTEYPDDVHRYEAREAIYTFRPHTVVASWVTQKFKRGIDVVGEAYASVYGVDEEWLVGKVARYILIGNEAVHAKKRIMAIPHETHSFPWLVSRAAEQSLNRIWVWQK